MRYLDKIDSPVVLKRLNINQLKVVAREIREFMIQSVASTGGHLASNLGVVELTIALHYCLDSPKDKILWDVGHQGYPHKILTGRKDMFDTLRQFGGLSGFIKSGESPHDAFDVGHSSTSLSAAHGLAASRDLLGQSHNVVVVIGDGSLTSGLALEGLNNIGRSDTNLIVILNDNQMSISENVGALSRYLNDLRSAPTYISAKKDVAEFLQGFPVAGKFTRSFIEKAKGQLKYLLLQGALFEELGFKYYGPYDGHNLERLIGVINNAKKIGRPVLVHVRTEKGRGYEPARRRPDKFHGVEAFEVRTGVPKKASTNITYTDVFSKKIVEIAQKNDKIVAITAAMPGGTGLAEFKKRFPNRFFDVAIAESHAVTFAAGLAKGGLRPVVAIYSTFLQRAYDQILHDVCIQKLPVVFAIDRAGIVGADGETHQGIFDLSYLSHMPNMTVCAPSDVSELNAMLDFATCHDGPVAIRYPKDTVIDDETQKPTEITIGDWNIIKNGEKIAIVAVGAMRHTASLVYEKLLERGHSAALINPLFVKPISPGMIEFLRNFAYVFTLEDNVYSGGFGQGIQTALLDFAVSSQKFHAFAIDDCFPQIGSRSELFADLQLDAESVFNTIMVKINE